MSPLGPPTGKSCSVFVSVPCVCACVRAKLCARVILGAWGPPAAAPGACVPAASRLRPGCVPPVSRLHPGCVPAASRLRPGCDPPASRLHPAYWNVPGNLCDLLYLQVVQVSL